jgi:hypothetical protein
LRPNPQTFSDPRQAAALPLFSKLYWAARPPVRLMGGTFLA